MHLPFAVTAHQLLWTLTFAAYLVLLVVFVARKLYCRLPFFTALTVLLELRLLAENLLTGRLAMLDLQKVLLAFADLSALVSILVAFELWQKVFGKASCRFRKISLSLGTLASIALLIGWGPWLTPARIAPALAPLSVKILNAMVLFAAPRGTLLVFSGIDKGNLLAAILLLLAGTQILIQRRRTGTRFNAEAVLVSVATTFTSLFWLGTQLCWQILVRTTHFHSREEYTQFLDLGGRFILANHVVNLLAILWWIGWLWFDEEEVVAPSVPTASEVTEAPAEPPSPQESADSQA